MAGLVDYSSSSEDEPATPPGKRRKLSQADEKNQELPPLPAAFLDQYSSTVRTSAQDDPSLHGGRKRVTPHVQGNWPTHVYLECKYNFPSLFIKAFPHHAMHWRNYTFSKEEDSANAGEGTQT